MLEDDESESLLRRDATSLAYELGWRRAAAALAAGGRRRGEENCEAAEVEARRSTPPAARTCSEEKKLQAWRARGRLTPQHCCS